MILLGVSDLCVSFGGKSVLENVSFSVQEGARVGVIGVNGVGKTTLFRMIAGGTPDSGSVMISKGATVGMLAQMTDLSAVGGETLAGYMEGAFPELLATERELAETEHAMSEAAGAGDERRAADLSAKYDDLSARFAREGGATFRAKCRSMLVHLGFGEETHDRFISTLSGGQHTRLALARLLAREPDLLLLDEPTNHLDIDALKWLEDYLAAYPKTVMIVSHDRYFLDRAADHILHISHTRAKMYKGNYTAAKEQRDADEASLEKRRREQQKIRARIEANIEFQRRCGQEHNFVTIRSKEKQLARMEKIESVKGERSIRMRFDEGSESAANVLGVRDLRFGYDSAHPLFDGLSFEIRRGERVLILGNNGTGKSTLMRLLSGQLYPKSGYIDFGYNVQVGYYDQEIRGLDLSRTVMEELHSTFPDRTELEIRSALALFLFGADDIFQTIGSLSGGERARVLLCKLMLKKVNLLLLDEPTNHLDITSREALEEALSDFDGTVIAVSHDRYFIDRTASRIIEILPPAEGGLIDYRLEKNEGAYTTYTALRESRAAPQTEDAVREPTDSRIRYEQQKKERAEKSSAVRRREQAKKRIAELEEEITSLAAQMNDPENATDYVLLSGLSERHAAAEDELLTLYEEWM